MSSEFDPYYTWLGIPPAEQPANHYRLLGVRFLEDSAEVISNAADRQMAHLRTFQGGPHSALSQKLLNEVAAAKVCLLCAERKADYDRSLRAATATPPAAERSDPVPPVRKAKPESDPALDSLFEKVRGNVPVQHSVPQPASASAETPSGAKVWLATGSAVAGAVLVIGLAVVYFTSRGASVEDASKRAPSAGKGHLVLIWPEAARVGAKVGIDGRPCDLTRDSARSSAKRVELALERGKHTIRIVPKDGEPFEKSFSLTEGNRLEMVVPASGDATLPPSGIGELVLLWPEAERDEATLEIDGELCDLNSETATSSPTDIRFNLPAGSHTIQIARAGFEPFDRDIVTKPDTAAKLAVSWIPLPPVSDGRGLRAEIFQGDGFENLIKVRYDPQINFNWIEDAPDEDVYQNDFTIRWTGWIKAPVAGKYRVVSIHDDSVRLYLDGRRIIDDWGRHYPEARSTEFEFDDKPHAITIEYREGEKHAAMSLRWVYPGGVNAYPVPPEALFCNLDLAEETPVDIRIPTPQEEDPEQTPVCGLKAELFAGENFDRLVTTRIDTHLDWLWGAGAPAPGVPRDKFSIRWTGWLLPPQAGRYRLVMHCDTGARVQIGEQTVFDEWNNLGRHETEVDLTAEPQPIRIEHRERSVSAAFNLRWVPPGRTYAIPIPPWCLRPAQEEKKVPLPDETAQRDAKAKVDEEFKIAESRTSREQAELAERLFEVSKDTTDDPARRYGLLLATLQTAYKARRANLMLQAIDEVDKHFEGYDPLQKKFDGLKGLAKSTANSHEAALLVQSLTPLTGELLFADRYDQALEAAAAAAAVATKAGKRDLQKEAHDCRKRLEAADELWPEYQVARDKLVESPDDAEAAEIAGRWRCFVCADWTGGLPLLAKGPDSKLTEVVRADMANPADAAEQVHVADHWYALAQSPGPELLEFKTPLRDRARYWYATALDDGSLSLRNAMRSAHRMASLGDQRVPPASGNMLAGRHAIYRAALVKSGGGTEGSERAVALALKWLAVHQFPDGGWSFDHGSCPNCSGRCTDGGAMAAVRNAATALALLPFLGAGQTHKEGKYKETVKQGLRFLCQRIKIGKNGGSFHERDGRFYSHGLTSIALCEAYGMTQDPALRQPAQAAVNFTAYAQDPVRGGWRYEPRKGADTSVTGWQVMALKTAAAAGLDVPRATESAVVRFLDSVQTDSGSKYGYERPGDKITTSTIGLLCRTFTGWKHDHMALQRGVTRSSEYGFSSSGYHDYYTTLLMRHYGGDQWRTWNEAMLGALLPAQSTEGHMQGSWYFDRGHFSEKAGRLGDTAIAALMLESYYRHLPIYAKTLDEEGHPADSPEGTSDVLPKGAASTGAITRLLAPSPSGAKGRSPITIGASGGREEFLPSKPVPAKYLIALIGEPLRSVSLGGMKAGRDSSGAEIVIAKMLYFKGVKVFVDKDETVLYYAVEKP